MKRLVAAVLVLAAIAPFPAEAEAAQRYFCFLDGAARTASSRIGYKDACRKQLRAAGWEDVVVKSAKKGCPRRTTCRDGERMMVVVAEVTGRGYEEPTVLTWSGQAWRGR